MRWMLGEMTHTEKENKNKKRQTEELKKKKWCFTNSLSFFFFKLLSLCSQQASKINKQERWLLKRAKGKSEITRKENKKKWRGEILKKKKKKRVDLKKKRWQHSCVLRLFVCFFFFFPLFKIHRCHSHLLNTGLRTWLTSSPPAPYLFSAQPSLSLWMCVWFLAFSFSFFFLADLTPRRRHHNRFCVCLSAVHVCSCVVAFISFLFFNNYLCCLKHLADSVAGFNLFVCFSLQLWTVEKRRYRRSLCI